MKENESPLFVRVTGPSGFNPGGIDIFIGLRYGPGDIRILHQTGQFSKEWTQIADGESTYPTLGIDDDMGRALLDALLRYYQGASDLHQVRQDYLEERKRVDNLQAVISNALNRLVDYATKPVIGS